MTNSNNLTDNDKLFRRLALLTVIIIYLLILAGGIVRSTGSGMGCPDWPKCFGQWVPPTHVSQLPSNYQAIYSHRGYANTTFNPAKTWIEYVNRLLGVLTGFFIFFTLLASIRYRKRDVTIPALSFLAFLLVGVQGWLGSVVVKMILAPWIVTLHMLLALVIVGLLLYVVARTYVSVAPPLNMNDKATINRLLLVSTALLLIQILMGTQVREHIDYIAGKLGDSRRNDWVNSVGVIFYLHRSFSLLVLSSQIWWLSRLRKIVTNNPVNTLATWVVVTIVSNIIVGVIMAYFAIPPVAQPVHLTLAVVSLGIQFVVLLLLNGKEITQAKTISTTNKAVV